MCCSAARSPVAARPPPLTTCLSYQPIALLLQALGGSPTAAASPPAVLPAAGREAASDLLFCGFGSPVRGDANSPDALPVSIGAAVVEAEPAGRGTEADATSAASPAVAGEGLVSSACSHKPGSCSCQALLTHVRPPLLPATRRAGGPGEGADS